MTTEIIQKLRQQTGAGILEIKKALEEAQGDAEKAQEILRKRGETVALKKGERIAAEGVIASYVHMGRIGVLVELNCETDFVARLPEFNQLAKDLAMQVASMNPFYVDAESVPNQVLEKEKEIYRAQIVDSKKSSEIMESIINGKLMKFYKENCLLSQPFWRDEKKTVKEILTAAIAKIGENIKVRRFVRYNLKEV